MRFIATVYYWLLFVTTATFGFCLALVLLLFTFPFDPQRKALHTFVTTWTFQYLRIWPGWSARVSGRENLPTGPAVIIANHQSMADVVAVMGLYHQFKFVSKSSLFKLPIIGWLMTLMKYVSLDRGKPHSTQKMLEQCRQWLRSGMSVVIFPEGTYATGETMLPFKRGPFMLAIEEKVPVVPVLIRGTPDLVHEDGPWMSPRAAIRLEVLPPVPPEALGDDDVKAASAMRQRYLTALGRLETPAAD